MTLIPDTAHTAGTTANIRKQELYNLLTPTAFVVKKMFTADVNPDHAVNRLVARDHSSRQSQTDDLGQYIFASLRSIMKSKGAAAGAPRLAVPQLHEGADLSPARAVSTVFQLEQSL